MILWAGCPFVVGPFPEPKWVPNDKREAIEHTLFLMSKFLRCQCWETCCGIVDKVERSTIMAELNMFNFCHLPGTVGSEEFTGFMEWLNQDPVGILLYTAFPMLMLFIVL